MALLSCDCVQAGNMPIADILANIYCADLAIYNGGGGGGGLPDQSGHAGEFLTTNGTVASWAPISGGGDVTASGNLTLDALILGLGGTTITASVTPAAGILTWIQTPSSVNLKAAMTDETGSGALVFATSPTLVTPILGTITSGNLGAGTVDGTNLVGFRGVPQNAQTGNYTTVLADAGKHIFHASGAGAGDTYTIDGSVAYVIGAAITFVNLDSNVLSIAIGTDTLVLAGAGTTGTRTLAQYGIATAVKVTASSWLINGTNLT